MLVVDDHDDTREMYAWCLRASGWHVVEARDGEAALAIAGQLEPDAIVMDLILPGVGGVDAIRLLRRDPRTSRAVIVVCTGLDVARGGDGAEAAGCDALVQKPLPPDDLCDLLRSLVTERRLP